VYISLHASHHKPPAIDAIAASGHRRPWYCLRRRRPRRRQPAACGSAPDHRTLLDAWWQRLAGRLDAGPAALHRLPEPVLHAAEGLWLQTLNEARKRAATEQGSSRASLARDRQELEVRGHVLAIRESELTARITQAENRTAHLEREIEALTTLLRKEQASRLAAARLRDVGDVALRRRRGGGRAPQPTAAAAKAKANAHTKSRKPATKSTRVRPSRPPTLKAKRR
jgi:hypothetical protein